MTTTGGDGEPGRERLDREAYEHLFAHLYGRQQPAPPVARYGPDHPQAATVLVLGILGAATFGLLAPVAWAMGSRVVREIDDSRGYLGGRGPAQAGRVLGMVSTLLFGASLVFFVLMLTMFGLLSLTV